MNKKTKLLLERFFKLEYPNGTKTQWRRLKKIYQSLPANQRHEFKRQLKKATAVKEALANYEKNPLKKDW